LICQKVGRYQTPIENGLKRLLSELTKQLIILIEEKNMSVTAVTQELKISVRVASFYPIELDEILKDVTAIMEKHGQKQNFLVWRTKIDSEFSKFQGQNNEP
jgi:hypothetical protein